MIKLNNHEVICPECCYPFRAILVSVQHELTTANERIRELEAELNGVDKLAVKVVDDASQLMAKLVAEREVSDKLEKALRMFEDGNELARAAIAEVAAIRSKGE